MSLRFSSRTAARRRREDERRELAGVERSHVVVDAFSGARLDGVPSYDLIAQSVVAPTAVPARLFRGVWVVATPDRAERRVRAELGS